MHRIYNPISFWLLIAMTIILQAGSAHSASADVLGPGDNVRVTVFQNPDFTTETRISSQGTILMPLVGQIDLRGLAPNDAAGRIAEQLRDGKFLVDPQVSLIVLQVRSRQVSVLGQVARPGRYVLDDSSMRLVDVLAMAGGITPTGDDLVTVMTTRDGKAEKLSIDITKMYQTADTSSNVELANDDTIFVPRAPVFYIHGQVKRAGSYRLDKNTNVVQAVALSGGLTERGTERGMRVQRRSADGKLSQIEVQPADIVKPDDVIQVQESFF